MREDSYPRRANAALLLYGIHGIAVGVMFHVNNKLAATGAFQVAYWTCSLWWLVVLVANAKPIWVPKIVAALGMLSWLSALPMMAFVGLLFMGSRT